MSAFSFKDSPRSRIWIGLALSAFALVCFWLGMGPFSRGPSEWDDVMYCDVATTGENLWELRNRYVHIWSLRLFGYLGASRPLTAAAYSTCVVIGIGFLVFVLTRRIAGNAGGLFAMALTPLFPPMLRYISAPHVDLTMTLWVLAALATALRAIDGQTPSERTARWFALASGCATLLALESKETALPLLLLLAYLFATQARQERSARNLGFWLGGLVLGALLLTCLDAAFGTRAAGHAWSANPLEYFGTRPASEPRLALPRAPSMSATFRRRSFDTELTQASFWAFTFLGLAGLASGFRKHLTIKALALWLFGSVALTALVAFRSIDIQIYDRYTIGPGAALVIFSAYRALELWQRPRAAEWENTLWLVPLTLVLLVPSLYALFVLSDANTAAGVAAAAAAESAQRAVFFVLPIAMLVLFMAPWLSGGRALPFACALTLLGVSGFASVNTAREHTQQMRSELAPWTELVRALDRSRASLAVWDAPLYPERRVLWRYRLLSRRAPGSLAVRTLTDPTQARADEWIFSRSCRRKDLLHGGMQYVTGGMCDDRTRAWSVYRKPAPSK